jgi:hypothetical protein
LDFAERAFWIWSEDDTRRYFIAAGGSHDQFDANWANAMAHRKHAAEAIAHGTYTNAGGSLCYLVSGRKRETTPAA